MMLLALFIEKISAWLNSHERFQHFDKLHYRQLEWHSNPALQTQRLAHEKMGARTWEKGAGAVPVTAYGDTLGVIDMSDKKHTRWIHPNTTGNTSANLVSPQTWGLRPKNDFAYSEVRSVPQTLNTPDGPDTPGATDAAQKDVRL